MGIEVLEKMLDEFDELYGNEKEKLGQKLSTNDSDNSERKVVLDSFFEKIE